MLFSRFILRPLLKERLRSVLAITGVALGVAVMLAIQMANQGALRGFSAAIDAVSGKAALEISAPPLGIDESILPSLSWLRQYGVAAPVIEADVTAEIAGQKVMLRVIGVDALRDPALRDYALADAAATASGMQLMTFLEKPRSLVLAGAFAARYGLGAGDEIKIIAGDQFAMCTIASVVGTAGGSGLAAQSIAIMDIGNAQELLGRPGRIDRLELRLNDGQNVDGVERVLREKLADSLSVQRPQRRGAAVEKMLAAFHFNLTMLSGIALVVGLFLIYNTVAVAVMTRRQEIGMLRTLGVTRLQVLGCFAGEAALLGFAGALLGVPLAKLLAEGAIRLTATTVDTLYVSTAAKVPGLDWTHWAMALGVALPLAILAALIPALEAAGVPPVAAIRGQMADARVRRGAWRSWTGAVGFSIAGFVAAQQPAVGGLPLWGYFACGAAIIAMALLVPMILAIVAKGSRRLFGRLFGIEGKLACGQIQASTQRLSISVAALAVSLALTVAIAVMVGSFRTTVLYWVNQSMGADLYVRPGTPPRSANPPAFSQATLNALKSHPAVETFEGYRAMDLPFRDRIVKLGTSDFEVLLAHPRLALKTSGDSASIIRQARAEGQILVSESFTLRFGLSEGSTFELRTQQGLETFRIAAQFYDYSNDSGSILMDRPVFERCFGLGAPTHVAIYLKSGSNADAVREEMLRSLDPAAFIAIFTNVGLRGEVLRIFDSTFAITWALEIISVLVAMAGVAATMLTLVLERREEILLLRIAGADASQVRRMLLIESGLIGAVSQGLGLCVGLLLSLVLIHVINPQSFGWSIRLHTPWSFLAAATVLTVLATMLAGLYPAWRATRDPLQSSLR
jgi:putative ABC transport system permease protein